MPIDLNLEEIPELLGLAESAGDAETNLHTVMEAHQTALETTETAVNALESTVSDLSDTVAGLGGGGAAPFSFSLPIKAVTVEGLQTALLSVIPNGFAGQITVRAIVGVIRNADPITLTVKHDDFGASTTVAEVSVTTGSPGLRVIDITSDPFTPATNDLVKVQINHEEVGLIDGSFDGVLIVSEVAA